MTLSDVLRRSLKRRASSVGCMAPQSDCDETQVGAIIIGNSLACLKAALHLSISRMHPVLIEVEGQLEHMSTADLRIRDDCYQAGCAFTRVEFFSELEFVTSSSSSSAVGVKLSSTWTSGSALRAARTYCSNLIFMESSVAPPHRVCSSWSLLRGPELTVMSGNSGAWLMTEHLLFKMLQHTALLASHKFLTNASCVAPWLQAPTAAPSPSASPAPSPTSCRETRTPSSTSSISTKASWRQAFFAKPVSPAHSEQTSVSLH
jgi:hypothetical protein